MFDWTEVVVGILQVLIPIVIAALAPLVGKWIALKNKEAEAALGEANYSMLTRFAEGAARAAEKSIVGSASKKEFATGLLLELADRYNIPVTEMQINALIEAAVQALDLETESGFLVVAPENEK